MKFKLVVSILFIGQLLSGQVFTESPLRTPIQGFESAILAFSDVDNDGDRDVVISGRNEDSTPQTKLYFNDGNGNFTEILDAPFRQVARGSIVFSDIDGDNDEDVLITGQNTNDQSHSTLYINDGQGNFTEMLFTSFDPVTFSSIAFSDIDSDGDEDVLITGVVGFNTQISKLYTNDGQGNFTEILDTPFEPLYTSSIAFSDVDNDGDEDVLITGKNSSINAVSKLYVNDGQGIFRK